MKRQWWLHGGSSEEETAWRGLVELDASINIAIIHVSAVSIIQYNYAVPCTLPYTPGVKGGKDSWLDI